MIGELDELFEAITLIKPTAEITINGAISIGKIC